MKTIGAAYLIMQLLLLFPSALAAQPQRGIMNGSIARNKKMPANQFRSIAA
jgi:hypothetical protein